MAWILQVTEVILHQPAKRVEKILKWFDNGGLAAPLWCTNPYLSPPPPSTIQILLRNHHMQSWAAQLPLHIVHLQNPQAVKTSDDKYIKTIAKEDQCSTEKQR